MNRADFDKLVAETVKVTADLLVAKGAEYAGDGDRLANFKRNALKNGQTVLQTWAVYWGKHIDSINTYLERVQDGATCLALRETSARAAAWRQHHPGELVPDALFSASMFRTDVAFLMPKAMAIVDGQLSEPIEGRFHDNINYSFLVLALLKELRSVEKGYVPATRIEDSAK